MAHAAGHGDPFAADPDMNSHADWRVPRPAGQPVIYGRTIGTEPSTIPFPAVTPDAPAPAPMLPACHCDLCEWAVQAAAGYDGPCRCDQCKYATPPGAEAVLYSGPDTVRLMTRAAVRDGRYEDIPAYADAALARAHLELNDAARRIRRDMEHAILRVGPERVAAATARMQAEAASGVLA